MKRGIFLSLLFIILAIPILAQTDEFSVRFHSFGKNATIDLKQYLRESEYYLASQTTNVIVNIDQEKGIATLKARAGWEGAEVVFFRTNESIQKLNDTYKIAQFLPEVPKILVLRRIRDNELARLFEGTIDPGIIDMIKQIKREEIEELISEIEENMVTISINDEVDLKMELGYIPAISMDFSLGEEKEAKEIESEEVNGFEIRSEILIAIFSIAIIIGIYIYIKHSKKKEIKRKDLELEEVISKDIKQLTLYKLRKLQKGTIDMNRFTNIVREFFSRYFGINYDFEFQDLTKRVKTSDLSGSMKDEINEFLNDLSKIVNYPSEEWTKIYGKGKISRKDKKLITRMKRIVRNL